MTVVLLLPVFGIFAILIHCGCNVFRYYLSEKMDINDQKEAFGKAYARAVASIAGFNCVSQEFDRDSIDIGFKSGVTPFVTIEAQLKTTSRPDVVCGHEIHFPLPIKNYNDLREDTIMPRILVIMLLPFKLDKDEDELPSRWMHQTAEQLSMMKCAYWINLKGQPESTNQTTVTITIPMDSDHIFMPSVLTGLANEVITSQKGGNDAKTPR